MHDSASAGKMRNEREKEREKARNTTELEVMSGWMNLCLPYSKSFLVEFGAPTQFFLPPPLSLMLPLTKPYKLSWREWKGLHTRNAMKEHPVTHTYLA